MILVDFVESNRLVIRELDGDDLSEVLPIFLSNPKQRELTEGSGGIVGQYDLSMLERDWHIGQMMGRHMLGLYRKLEHVPVGIIDYLTENPSDGLPWIGVIEIHADHQRKGLAREAIEGFLEHFSAKYGWSCVRTGVPEENNPGRALAQALNFEPVKHVEKDSSNGRMTVVIFEKQLGI